MKTVLVDKWAVDSFILLSWTGRVNNSLTVDLRQVQTKVTVDAPAHNKVHMSAAGSVLPWSLVFLISFRTRGQDAASKSAAAICTGRYVQALMQNVSGDNSPLTNQIHFREQ